MSDKDRQQLLGIVEAITKIEQYIAPFDNADAFYDNTLNFDAVLMNFVVIGEMVERISEGCKGKYAHVDWVKIKDFRNIIAHDYFGVDAEEVWQIVRTHMKQLKKDVEKMLEEMGGRHDESTAYVSA